MPGILDLCEKYFKTRNLYEVLEIPKGSLEKDVKKAYYKISLKVHPDRVSEEEKEIATEKFKVLTKVHQVLTEKSKRDLYDEKGIIDDEGEEDNLSSWLELWKKICKPITTEDIDNYEKTYVGSELERADIKKAYMNGKGCINYMFDAVPFISVKDEPRLAVIIKEMIDANEVPEFKAFTQEPAAKRKRRHTKYERESIEAAKEMNSLKQQIMKNRDSSAHRFANLMDNLVKKYGNGEDEVEDEIIHFADIPKIVKKRKKVVEKKKAKPKERLVKNGKVKRKATK